MQGEGERATGTPNTIYDLSSVLFHALEGGASYDTYIEDAEREGDQELADFFRQVRDEDSNRADRAQQLLAERTTTAERAGDMTSGAVSGTGVAGVALGAEEVPPRTGDAPFGTEDVPPPAMGEMPPVAGQTLPGREDPLSREDPLPREERDSLGREDPLPREERASLGREDPRPGEERAGETEREEDRGLIDKAIDKISGGDEERDRPDRRS
jgi:hypothetical protein